MKLVERDTELSIMESMLESCAAGHGGIAWISGSVASGKTALLHAFSERVAADEAVYAQATACGAESEKDQPLGVMRQLLLSVDLPAADAALAAELLDLSAVAAPVRAAGAAGGAVSAEVAIDVFPRLCGILLTLARKRPLVLSIDDVHHADPHSLECLLYLAYRLEVSRTLVVLGESSGFEWEHSPFRDELLRRPVCRLMRLDPLPRHGVTEMIAADPEGRRARALVSDFHRLSGGSPLLMRALLEDYRASAAVGAAELVPGSAFEQAVVACLRRVDVPTRHAARALAVLGQHASHADLTAVLGVAQAQADRSVTALNDAGLLSFGWFRHEAGQAAVLQSMEPPQRAHLEARVACVLHEHGATATVLARHLIVAEPVEAPWTLPTLLEAAERALAGDEVGLALDALRLARDTCSDERQALTVTAALMRAGWRVDPSSAAQHLPELTAAALAGRLGDRDTGSLVDYLLWFGHVDQALEVLDAGRRHRTNERREADPATRAHIHVHAHARADAGDAAAASPELARPEEGTERFDFVRLWMAYGYPGLPGPDRCDAVGLPHEALTPAQGAQHRAVDMLRVLLEEGAREEVIVQAEEILRGTRLDDRTLAAVMAALVSLVCTGALDETVRWCDLLFKEATQRRAPMWQGLFASARAFAELRLGEPANAEESAHAALTLVSPEGWGTAVASPLAALLYAKTVLGRLDEAAVHLNIPVPDAAFHTTGGLLYLWARGHYHLAAGRPCAALADFNACGDFMIKWDLDLPALVPWRADAARACLALGDEHRAGVLAAEQLATVGTGRTWARGVSLRVLAATVPLERRLRLLDEAIDILQESGHRLELAGAVRDAARAHHELGYGERGRDLARRARQLMRECGIAPSARTEDGDDRGGGDDGGDRDSMAYGPAKDAPDGSALDAEPEQPWPPSECWQPVELSEAELRVATLAARGLTNRQIAGKLFITISTVEQHLTRVYRKLDVQRRTDLAQKLMPSTSTPAPGVAAEDAAATGASSPAASSPTAPGTAAADVAADHPLGAA